MNQAVFLITGRRSLCSFWAALGCLALGMAGCDAPEARFVLNERSEALMQEAREGMLFEQEGERQELAGIADVLGENFGTPQNLVAWMKLPVDFGVHRGTVLQAQEPLEGPTQTIPVSFESEVEGELSGLGIQWVSGVYEGQTLPSPVQSYDAENRLLRLGDQLQEPPQPGDEFVIVGTTLKQGRALYMEHCMHCHGVSGDGNGPTAPYLNPEPRDYRQGLFKFTATKPTEKICRADLEQTIREGIPGTYMPSFMLLEDEELGAIVEYVRWLAMRGELEHRLDSELEIDYSQEAYEQRLDDGEERSEILEYLADYLRNQFPAIVDDLSTDLADAWQSAEEPSSLIVPEASRPPADEASLARGRALFVSAKAKCATCHGVTGRGDGPQTQDFQQIPGTQETYENPGLHDEWGNPIEPRNLRRGIYRGGRRPVDLYRRIYAGIKGTPMPAFGGSVLSDREIWDLVNYVMHLPYEGQSQETIGVEGRQMAARSAPPAN